MAHVELGIGDTYFQYTTVYIIVLVLSNNISLRISDCLDDVAIYAWWIVVRCAGYPLRRIAVLPRREVLFEVYRRAKVRAETYLRMPPQLMSL